MIDAIFCVCIEETSQQAHSHPQKRKCLKSSVLKHTTDSSGGRHIAYMIYRALSVPPELMNLVQGLIRSVQYTLTRIHDVQDVRLGSSSIISKRYAFRCDPGRIVQVKNTGLCSASDFLTTKKLFETMDRQVIYD